MFIPADIPKKLHEKFKENYTAITRDTDKLMLFAGDQKIEHMNPIHPKELFAIANKTSIGVFATHLGLIARYGTEHKKVNYLVKLNAKTNLTNKIKHDPISLQLWTVKDVIDLQKSSELKIRGVGYTIYLGSEYEAQMLKEAAHIIQEAHKHGLVTILWIYPRGKAVKEETHIDGIAGAAGVANSLGSDFVKLKAPETTTDSKEKLLNSVIQSAGNTKVICAGGTKKNPEEFLKELHAQLTVGGTAGSAVGRNIYQHGFKKGCKIAEAISALIYKKCTLEYALSLIK